MGEMNMGKLCGCDDDVRKSGYVCCVCYENDKKALEEKLRVATEALEWIEKHSYVTNEQWDDVPTMSARKAKEALAKLDRATK